MRKDLRVGLGIGGVLLAVLVVAYIASPGSKKAKQQASAQNDPAAAPEGTEVPPTADGTAPPPAGAATDGAAKPPVDEVFGDPNTPQLRAQKSPVGTSADWDKLFNAGGAGGAVVTDTPTTPSSKNRTGGAIAGLSARDEGASTPDGTLLKSEGTSRRTPTRTGSATGAAAPAGGRTYVVQQGDTLVGIARSVYGNDRAYLQIQSANPGLNANALRVGTRINLPAATAGATRTAAGNEVGNGRTGGGALDRNREYRVAAGDSLHRIAQKLYGDSGMADAIYEANKQAIGTDPARLKLGTVLRLPEPPTVAAVR